MSETITINQNTGVASSILDGITFGNINLAGGYAGIDKTKFAHKQSQYDPNGGNARDKIFNAVDIDWNSAVIPNGDIENGTSKTINTTGDLLSLINKMQEEIYVLSAAVVALAAKVG